MRKLTMIGAAALLAIATTACTAPAPTTTDTAAPSFDGGYLGGSGNKQDSTVTPTSSATADSGGTGRGGYLGGSGN